MKIDIDEVEAVLLQKKIEPVKVQEIVTELGKVAEEIKEGNAADKGEKEKWEHVIILNDKDGILKDKEIAGWVVQQREGDDAGAILAKLTEAAKSQNEAAKRKKNVISNYLDLFESLKSKFLKEKKVKIKTKELTRVIITDEKLK